VLSVSQHFHLLHLVIERYAYQCGWVPLRPSDSDWPDLEARGWGHLNDAKGVFRPVHESQAVHTPLDL
jgi:hypothetical protein